MLFWVKLKVFPKPICKTEQKLFYLNIFYLKFYYILFSQAGRMKSLV